jgi:HTH-type transcriptional regulator, sugar sensing transcriptional regulator
VNNVIEKLRKFNYSRMEAIIYITLLQEPGINGSKIAKILNIPRSTAYACLEGLYKKGAVYLLPGETNMYQAHDPEQLFEALKKEYSKDADIIKNKLSQYRQHQPIDQYWNIEGYDNFRTKVKQLLLTTKKEIYLNTNYDLHIFKDELELLLGKGVRIIVFSFENINSDNLELEFYYNQKFIMQTANPQKKMYLVVDFNKVLIASGYKDKECVATFTKNEALVALVSEHIHHDIYAHKLEEITGKVLFNGTVSLGTLQEKCFLKRLHMLESENVHQST